MDIIGVELTREAKSCDALTLQAKQTFTLKQKEAQLQTILYIWIEEYFVVHTSKIYSGLGPIKTDSQPHPRPPKRALLRSPAHWPAGPSPSRGPARPPRQRHPCRRNMKLLTQGKRGKIR